jgi:Family of unknown function (DUF6152)
MNYRTLLFLVIGVMLLSTAAQAHHSFAAVYDGKREITIEGKMVGFQYRNPHSYVQVEAPDENGVMQRWSVEWGGTAALREQGVERDSFKVGDDVIITGLPSRTPGEYRIRMNTMVRPADGKSWGTRAGEVVD